jgi:hypothetical protein
LNIARDVSVPSLLVEEEDKSLREGDFYFTSEAGQRCNMLGERRSILLDIWARIDQSIERVIDVWTIEAQLLVGVRFHSSPPLVYGFGEQQTTYQQHLPLGTVNGAYW